MRADASTRHKRADDRPESVRVRMQAYEASTRPLTDHYRQAGKLRPVLAAGTPEAILKRSLQALGEPLATAALR